MDIYQISDFIDQNLVFYYSQIKSQVSQWDFLLLLHIFESTQKHGFFALFC